MISLNPSCKSGPPAAPLVDEKPILAERVREYWKMVIDGKVERAYSFESPVYRQKVSVLYYSNRFRLKKYTDAELVEIDLLGPNTAKSKVKTTHIMILKNITNKKWTEIEEGNWVKIEGHWYHVPDDIDRKMN